MHADTVTSTDVRLPTRDKTIITILLLSAFVVILNETAMNVALDAVIVDLDIDERVAQWLTTGFLLTMATVIPITGWLMERFTTRSVYIAAMALFSAGTLIAAISGDFWMLLAGRIVQASGTALVFPLMMTTIMTLVPASLRGLVMGNVSLVIACAPALGPTVSGLILQSFHWRFIFLLVLPIALVVGVLGTMRMVSVGEPTRPHLDIVSVPLAALGFGGAVFALSSIGDATAPAWELPVAAVVGVAALAGFALRQRMLQRRDEALLDLRVFRFGNYTRTVLVMVLAMMAMFGAIIELPLVLQRALHHDPIVVGLTTLPGALIMGALGPPVGRLYDRVGPRPLVVPGAVVVLAALLAFSLVRADSPLWFFVTVHVVLSLGLAFTFPVLFTVSLGSLPKSLYGHGSAIVATVQQVAGAAGTALFVTVLTTTSTGLQEEGMAFTPAYVEGARMAFLFAAALWVVGIALVLTLRKPADEIPDTVHGAHGASAEEPAISHQPRRAGAGAAGRVGVVDDILQFLGHYWWGIFIVGPMIGGWITGAAKYNERRRRDRLELERVRRGYVVQGPQPVASVPSAPAVSPQADIDRVLADHDAIEARWLSYELDPGKLIDFPLMTDMREQVTRDFHTAKRKAAGLRPDDLEVLRDPARLAAYRDAVLEFETAFDIALGEAKRRRQQGFSNEERDRLETARRLLGIAADEAATAPERQSAYRQARKALDGLIVLPQATTDDLEHRIAGALEA